MNRDQNSPWKFQDPYQEAVRQENTETFWQHLQGFIQNRELREEVRTVRTTQLAGREDEVQRVYRALVINSRGQGKSQVSELQRRMRAQDLTELAQMLVVSGRVREETAA